MNTDRQTLPTKALLAIVLGIIGIVLAIAVVGLLFAIAAIILGHKALSELRQIEGRPRGEGLAVAGLILGYASIPLASIAALFACTSLWFASHTPGARIDPAYAEAVSRQSPECVYTQVVATLGAGNQREAEALLDCACELYPTDQRLLFANAVCAHSRFSKQRSGLLFYHVARMDPASYEGQCAICITALEQKQDVPERFRELTTLVEKAPTNTFFLWVAAIQCRTLTREYGGTNYSVKGAEYYRRLLEQWETGPVLVHQTYANILSEELDRSEEALPHRLLAVKLEPKGWTYQGLGNTLKRLGRYEEASEAFAKCTELAPGDATFWCNWGSLLDAQGDYRKSEEKYRKAIELNPTDDELWGLLGRGLMAQGRFEEALNAFQTNLVLCADNTSPAVDINRIREIVKMRKRFPAKLQEFVSLSPTSIARLDAYAPFSTNLLFTTTDVRVLTTFCAASAGVRCKTNAPPSDAIEACDLVVTLTNRTKHEVRMALYDNNSRLWGHFASFTGDRQSADLYAPVEGSDMAVWVAKNIRLPPNRGIGKTLMMLERYGPAGTAFSRYSKACSDDPRFLRDWASYLSYERKEEQAIEKCRRAIELNPREEYAWRVWGDCLRSLGRTEEALQKYEQHLLVNPDDPVTQLYVYRIKESFRKQEELQLRVKALKGLSPDTISTLEVRRAGSLPPENVISNRDVIAAFCEACSEAEPTLKSLSEVSATLGCVTVTTRNGDRTDLRMGVSQKTGSGLAELVKWESDRMRFTAYGAIEGKKMAAWTKATFPPLPQDKRAPPGDRFRHRPR